MIKLTEPIVDELLTVLEADLPGVIVSREPGFTPELEMKAIADYSHGEKQNHKMPAIEVIPGATPIVDDGMTELTMRHRIVVRIFANHATEETLTRLLERYAVCVIQTLMARRAGAGFTFDFQLATEDGAQIDWGLVTSVKPAMFQNDVMFEIVATTTETLA